MAYIYICHNLLIYISFYRHVGRSHGLATVSSAAMNTEAQIFLQDPVSFPWDKHPEARWRDHLVGLFFNWRDHCISCV